MWSSSNRCLGQTSEIATLQSLLTTLHLSQVCFCLEVLHSKKVVQQSISSGNDYSIALKANPPNLFKLLAAHLQPAVPLRVECQVEQTRERQRQRRVTELASPAGIDPDWLGVQRMIKVDTSGTGDQKPVSETVVYLISLTLAAGAFVQRIGNHWQVENRLDWVKDGVVQADNALLGAGHVFTNFAIVRIMAVNLFCVNGVASIT